VKNTQKITSAMKMVAAARLRRAEERARMARPYADRLQSFLDRFTIDPENIPHPLAETRIVNRSGLLIITSDRGLCGSYNSNILREATKWLEQRDTDKTQLYIIGNKGNSYFKRRKWKIAKHFGNLDYKIDYKETKEITDTIANDFIDGKVDEVDLLYSRYVSPAVCRQTMLNLLPIKATGKEEHTGPASDFIYEPSPEEILEILFPKYLYTRIVTSLAESLASEQGQRMVAMSAATENAEEMCRILTLKYNKARQAAITKELLEIVGGADALEK